MIGFLTTISRHIVTIGIVVSTIWWLATPRAEEFVRQAVDDRLTMVEVKLDSVKGQLWEVIRRLERIEQEQERVQSQLQEQNDGN